MNTANTLLTETLKTDATPRSVWRTLGKECLPALTLFVVLTLLTGVIYPLVVTGIAQLVFPEQANGSLIVRNRNVVGSSLIGQSFSESKYLWGRPSATAPMAYNGLASGGSNLGPLNPALADAVKARIVALRETNPTQSGPVPQDLVTASASGLDPHISPQAASWQVQRIAAARGLPPDRVRAIIDTYTEGPSLGLFGETRVNVLEVNLALDALK